MSKMREAFEKWWKQYNFDPDHKARMHVAFDCGYQAAIADVKAGGPAAWKNPNPQHPEDWHSNFERRGWLPLYKLPEDV